MCLYCGLLVYGWKYLESVDDVGRVRHHRPVLQLQARQLPARQALHTMLHTHTTPQRRSVRRRGRDSWGLRRASCLCCGEVVVLELAPLQLEVGQHLAHSTYIHSAPSSSDSLPQVYQPITTSYHGALPTLMTNGDTSSRPISGAGWKPKRVSTPGSPFRVGAGSEAGDAGRASTTLLAASAASGCASMSHGSGSVIYLLQQM